MSIDIPADLIARADQEMARLQAHLDEEIGQYRQDVAELGLTVAAGLFVERITRVYGAQAAAGLLLAMVRRSEGQS